MLITVIHRIPSVFFFPSRVRKMNGRLRKPSGDIIFPCSANSAEREPRPLNFWIFWGSAVPPGFLPSAVSRRRGFRMSSPRSIRRCPITAEAPELPLPFLSPERRGHWLRSFAPSRPLFPEKKIEALHRLQTALTHPQNLFPHTRRPLCPIPSQTHKPILLSGPA